MIETVEISAVWLRRIGDRIEVCVCVQVDGEWRLAIVERGDNAFSHIAEAVSLAVSLQPREKV